MDKNLNPEWCTFQRVGLYVNRVPTLPEATDTSIALAQMMKSSPFWIGDFCNFLDGTFAQQYDQIVDVFGEHKYQTVANYRSVCKRVDYDDRKEELSFSHHKHVAPLDVQAQRYWLNRAVRECLTSEEMRRLIKGEAIVEEQREAEEFERSVEKALTHVRDAKIIAPDRAMGLIDRAIVSLEDCAMIAMSMKMSIRSEQESSLTIYPQMPERAGKNAPPEDF